jgi:hypothetical protein
LKKKTLKELTLSHIQKNFFSSESFSRPEFKLTSLAVDCYSFNTAPNCNFNAFVLAMADTLTYLHIQWFRAEDALLIQNLPLLKTLKAYQHQGERSLASYKPNTSIEVLDFISITTMPPAFLKSLTNVRSMCINSFGRDEFMKILENCPGLLELRTGYSWNMRQKDYEEIYAEVRSEKPSSVECLVIKIEGRMPFVLKL